MSTWEAPLNEKHFTIWKVFLGYFLQIHHMIFTVLIDCVNILLSYSPCMTILKMYNSMWRKVNWIIMNRWLKWNSKSLLLISLTYKSKGEYGIRLEVTQLTCILEPRHSTYPFTVIISAFKGALSRQSGSFCLILPITHPQLLWNLKWAKKLHINDKIRDLRQTIMSPEHYFWSCKQQGPTLKNC